MLLPFFEAFNEFFATDVGLTLGRVSKVWLTPFVMPATPKNSVSIGPGQTARQLILRGLSSFLIALEKLIT